MSALFSASFLRSRALYSDNIPIFNQYFSGSIFSDSGWRRVSLRLISYAPSRLTLNGEHCSKWSILNSGPWNKCSIYSIGEISLVLGHFVQLIRSGLERKKLWTISRDSFLSFTLSGKRSKMPSYRWSETWQQRQSNGERLMRSSNTTVPMFLVLVGGNPAAVPTAQ